MGSVVTPVSVLLSAALLLLSLSSFPWEVVHLESSSQRLGIRRFSGLIGLKNGTENVHSELFEHAISYLRSATNKYPPTDSLRAVYKKQILLYEDCKSSGTLSLFLGLILLILLCSAAATSCFVSESHIKWARRTSFIILLDISFTIAVPLTHVLLLPSSSKWTEAYMENGKIKVQMGWCMILFCGMFCLLLLAMWANERYRKRKLMRIREEEMQYQSPYPPVTFSHMDSAIDSPINVTTTRIPQREDAPLIGPNYPQQQYYAAGYIQRPAVVGSSGSMYSIRRSYV